MSGKDAEDLLGDAGKALRSHLERSQRRSLDITTLARLVSDRYNGVVPDKLFTSLFKAFASDGYVSIDEFLCCLAVTKSKDKDLRLVGIDHILSLSFCPYHSFRPSFRRRLVFRVYEYPAGQLQRQRVENILLLAYGDTHKSLIR
jgi:hypothetical protein